MKNKKPLGTPGGLPSDQAVVHSVRILSSFNR